MINTKKYTLISLFKNKDEHSNTDFFPLNNIEIPIIQRDYAQGRRSPDVDYIRSAFLRTLYTALVNNKPITLDFVYGKINEQKSLIPLDGQQRLTTLFLLHWYVARHEKVNEQEFLFLSKFSYATRYSAREFCKLLATNYVPNFDFIRLSDDIKDQSWLPLDWENDPTICSMLNMIDDIHDRFKDTYGLWKKLEEGCISFYFLPIDQLGATDELYIKMNSRGKPLTVFEQLKTVWETAIEKLESKLTAEQKSKDDQTILQRISHKIDLTWTDMLWPYRNGNTNSAVDNIIDDKFVRYFKFIDDIYSYKNNFESVLGLEDVLSCARTLLGPQGTDAALQKLKFIEDGFDCWVNVDIDRLFTQFLTNNNDETDTKKCVVNGPINVFAEVCWNDHLPFGSMLLLYAFVYYLQHKNTISESQFARRLRIVINLIKQSEYELREDKMTLLLQQTEYILNHGDVERASYTSFNATQLAEEHEKVEWLKEHPDKADILFKLENHPLLQGAIRVIGLEQIDFTNRFYSLFACDWSLVNRALLSIGDYSILKKWRFQIGSANFDSSWRDIFTTNNNAIKNVKNILHELLDMNEHFTNEWLKNFIGHYLQTKTKYDWRHYLIKYDSMRPERYGMYYWLDDNKHKKAHYDILMMCTEKSLSGQNYNIFLKTLYDKIQIHYPELDIYLGKYAHSGDGSVLELTFAKKYLFFANGIDSPNKLYICHQEPNNDGNEHEIIDIEECLPQDENGIDTSDRVELAYNAIVPLINNYYQLTKDNHQL